MDKEPEILTTDEAAELLRLSPYAVRDMARKKSLPAIKIGKGWRFHRQGLLDWVKEGKAETDPEQEQG